MRTTVASAAFAIAVGFFLASSPSAVSREKQVPKQLEPLKSLTMTGVYARALLAVIEDRNADQKLTKQEKDLQNFEISIRQEKPLEILVNFVALPAPGKEWKDIMGVGGARGRHMQYWVSTKTFKVLDKMESR